MCNAVAGNAMQMITAGLIGGQFDAAPLQTPPIVTGMTETLAKLKAILIKRGTVSQHEYEQVRINFSALIPRSICSHLYSRLRYYSVVFDTSSASTMTLSSPAASLSSLSTATSKTSLKLGSTCTNAASLCSSCQIVSARCSATRPVWTLSFSTSR